MKVDGRSWNKFENHCVDVYPQEAVCFIKDGMVILIDNISTDPENSFEIDPKEFLKHKPDGIAHSHPYNPDVPLKIKVDRRTPSKKDMETFKALAKPFGIVACDGMNVSNPLWLNDTEELLGRTFIHGYNDCYSVIRDWFKQEKGIDLPYMPRELGWWDAEGASSLYEDNFEAAGFKQIDARDIDIGDVSLMKVASKVTNHAAVFVKTNQIMHHLFGQLSTLEPYNQWMDREVMVLRYFGNE